MRVAGAVERRWRVARARREPVAELVHDDDEILRGVERSPWADLPFKIGVLRAVRGWIDDDVRLVGVQRAIGLVGKARVAVGEPRLQDDIARIKDLAGGHPLL